MYNREKSFTSAALNELTKISLRGWWSVATTFVPSPASTFRQRISTIEDELSRPEVGSVRAI
jgi:hypothetical protein